MRTIIGKSDGTDRTAKRDAKLRRRELDRAKMATWRSRKRTRDAMPRRIEETLKKGRDLLKAAKCLDRLIVKSVVEGLNADGGFQQLLNEIEGWGSPGSGSMPLDQTTDQSNFEVSGFAAGWQSHMVQTAGVTSDLCIGEDRPAADDRIGDQTLLDVDGVSLAYGTEGLARI